MKTIGVRHREPLQNCIQRRINKARNIVLIGQRFISAKFKQSFIEKYVLFDDCKSKFYII